LTRKRYIEWGIGRVDAVHAKLLDLKANCIILDIRYEDPRGGKRVDEKASCATKTGGKVQEGFDRVPVATE
jgi:hypothetical protein